jgi:hypothetical protein
MLCRGRDIRVSRQRFSESKRQLLFVRLFLNHQCIRQVGWGYLNLTLLLPGVLLIVGGRDRYVKLLRT